MQKKEPLFIPFLTNKLQLIEVFVELSKIVPVASLVAAAAAVAAKIVEWMLRSN